MTLHYLPLIDSPANAICAPHFSAKSCQLAIDGFSNIIKALEVNEAIATVLAGKTLTLTALVLQNSPVEIVGHSNVKSPRAAADDVDAVVVFFHKIHWP